MSIHQVTMRLRVMETALFWVLVVIGITTIALNAPQWYELQKSGAARQHIDTRTLCEVYPSEPGC